MIGVPGCFVGSILWASAWDKVAYVDTSHAAQKLGVGIFLHLSGKQDCEGFLIFSLHRKQILMAVKAPQGHLEVALHKCGRSFETLLLLTCGPFTA